MLCGSCFIIGVASICILFPSGLVKRLMRSRKWGYESFLILWSDFVKIQLTNVSEFTNSRTNISNFTNSRTIFCLFTIHEQHRFHEFTNDFFGFHEFTNEKKPIPACTNTAGGASYNEKNANVVESHICIDIIPVLSKLVEKMKRVP